jgi:hypothetical protein
MVGRDSVVGIETCDRLDVPTIDSRRGGGEIFHTRPDALGPTQTPWGPPSLLVYTVCAGSFPGVRRPGRDIN